MLSLGWWFVICDVLFVMPQIDHPVSNLMVMVVPCDFLVFLVVVGQVYLNVLFKTIGKQIENKWMAKNYQVPHEQYTPVI